MQWLTAYFIGAREYEFAVAIAALVIMAVAVGTGLTAQAGVNRKGDRARLYAATLKSLEKLERFGLVHARNAAAEGNEKDVHDFVATVHNIMAGEHAIWLHRPLEMEDSSTGRSRDEAQAMPA